MNQKEIFVKIKKSDLNAIARALSTNNKSSTYYSNEYKINFELEEEKKPPFLYRLAPILIYVFILIGVPFLLWQIFVTLPENRHLGRINYILWEEYLSDVEPDYISEYVGKDWKGSIYNEEQKLIKINNRRRSFLPIILTFIGPLLLYYFGSVNDLLYRSRKF